MNLAHINTRKAAADYANKIIRKDLDENEEATIICAVSALYEANLKSISLSVENMMEEICSILPANRTYHFGPHLCRIRNNISGTNMYVKVIEQHKARNMAIAELRVHAIFCEAGWKWKHDLKLNPPIRVSNTKITNTVKAFYTLARAYAMYHHDHSDLLIKDLFGLPKFPPIEL